MPLISSDKPLYFLTSVTKDRLPVFRTDTLKRILSDAFIEARNSSGILIFAYVIMLDHYHIITDSSRKPSDVLRYLNGISARRVINHLKENGHESSLAKLRKDESAREYKYSLWQHHSNTFVITSESKAMEKANYIHLNPVEEGLVDAPTDYLFSSFRYWANRPLMEDEPLEVDIKHLDWRKDRA
jgi:REP element-mobilizing transposase RayT